MLYGWDKPNTNSFMFEDCWLAKYDYFILTSGAWSNLRFKCEGHDGGMGATAPQSGSGIGHSSSLQDIMAQPVMAGVAGSIRLTVTCDAPCKIILREVPK